MPKRLTLALGLYLILAMGAAAQQAATFDTPDSATEECTTGVASGRATADGRPILWKNRDNSAAMNNEVNYFTDGKYNYLAVVTVGQPGSAWMGVNEKGFCIENSVISDLPRGGQSGAGNGGFMKLALQTCANLADFEALLKTTNVSGRRTLANFGVIDAEGGAAIFETSHVDYVKFDANDPIDGARVGPGSIDDDVREARRAIVEPQGEPAAVRLVVDPDHALAEMEYDSVA